MTILVRSIREDYTDERSVAILIKSDTGERLLAQPLVFSPLAESDFIDKPTIAARGPVSAQEFLQAVLNHAWELGLRPVGFADTPKQIEALQDHLADMRAIVFKGEVKPRGG